MARRSEAKKLGQHGPYWLSKHPKSDFWYLTHYDAEKRQTVRESLGTADFKEADRAVALHYLRTIEDDQPLAQDEFTLHNALDYYWAEYACNIASKDTASISIQYWKAGFANDILLNELTRPKLNKFIDHLRQHKPKLSEGYISRILSVGRAALKRVQRDGKVALVPYIPDNETKAQKLDKTAKGRPLTLEELARLFLCAEAPHLKLFMTIMTTTLCRPDAAFDLGPDQVDSGGGIINLNPEGRRQTKKYRPKVPLTKSLRPHLKGCKTATFVAYRGKRVSEIDTAWNTMVAKAELPNSDRINPYSIRHTLGRALRAAKIRGEDISLFLGHIPVGSNDVTGVYSPHDPEYLRDAAKAVDGYWKRLQAEIKRQAKTFTPRKNRPGQRNDIRKAA